MNELIEIGLRLRAYLKYKKLGINELARLAQTSGGQIHNILNGRKYGIDKMLNILKALPSINTNWLLYGIGEMEKNPDMSHADALLIPENKTDDQVGNLKNQLDAMNATIAYQNMTIEAYKRSLEITVSSNADLKEMMAFFKNQYEEVHEDKIQNQTKNKLI